jgi:biotin carboxyl carrier protein
MEKTFNINGNEIKVQDFQVDDRNISFVLNGKKFSYCVVHRDGAEFVLDNGARIPVAVGSPNRDGESMVMAYGREALLSEASKRKKKNRNLAGSLTSPMPGKIFKVIKEIGSEVKKGEPILILEAMKMEHSIRADKDGKVKNIFFKVGELVQGGVVLAEVES